MAESDLYPGIIMAASKDGHRLFRLNAGLCWAGKVVVRTAVKIVISPFYPIKLAVDGTSDLGGWCSDGKALYVEVKLPRARTDPERLRHQEDFIAAVLRAGGRAGFATSIDEARAIWGSDVNAR